MPAVKVGTCHYCGTKAALVLQGDTRHELACGTCGAPLHDLKMMPKRAASAPAPTHRAEPASSHKRAMSAKKYKGKSRKKKKGFARWAFEELWDVVEDIID